MSATATTMVQTSRIEDFVLLIGVTLGAAAQFLTAQGTTIFGMSPFLLSAVMANAGKGLAGLNDPRSYEDIILTVSSILGGIGTALAGNPMYAVYGIVIGQIGKAVLSLRAGFNMEDGLLVIMAALTAIGQGFNQPTLMNLGLFLAAISKALPSLAVATAFNMPAKAIVTPTKPAPSPVAPTA